MVLNEAGILSLNGFSPLISILLGIILGDYGILIFSFMGAQGITPFFVAPILFIFLGIIICDHLMFFLGRSRVFGKITASRLFGKMFSKIDRVIDKLSREKPIIAMIYAKTIMGGKTLTATYLGQKRTPIYKFTIASIIASALWSIVAGIVGFLLAKGVIWIFTVFKNLPLALTSFALVFGVYVHFHKKIHHHMIKKHSKKENKKRLNKKR